MNKIYQLIITLLIEKGYKLTKEVVIKLIADFKNRKKVKDCLDEKNPVDRAKCIKSELNDKL